MKTMTVRRHAGFTLIEALIAMLVLAFGLLAVAGLQTTLAHNSDVAKQRTEATRLAQAKIEDLRAFQQLPAASGIPAYADIANGNDAPATTTNTSFARTWTVTNDPPALTQKLLRVSVDWVDRQGQPQNVLLSSVISKSDPAEVGTLSLQQPGAQDKKPYYGMPPIPNVGKYIGGGRSAIQLPSGGAYIVFSSTVDATISRCMGTVTSATNESTVCTDPLSAFLITGFISGLPSPSFDTDAQANAVTLRLVDGAGNPVTPAAECFVTRVANDGTFPRDPGSPAPTSFVSSFYQYVCLIQPVASGPNAGTWTGKLQVVEADAGVSLMQTNDRICRLSWDQDASGASGDINREHPDLYTNVTGTLQNQNFRYVPRINPTTAAGCPGSTTVNGVLVTFSSVNVIP
jgi:type IV pilus modification protein PilV